jgi:transcriptional regulator of acetoin/glycerol metabolism
MTELRKYESDMNLARRYPVCVLITAPPNRALAIASAISDADIEDLVIHEVHGLNQAQQTALLRLLETDTDRGRCRVIATSSTGLFERVREGTFLEALFYRLNVIHIVSDSLTRGRGTSASSIIAA